jgi:hypothetical protein
MLPSWTARPTPPLRRHLAPIHNLLKIWTPPGRVGCQCPKKEEEEEEEEDGWMFRVWGISI